MQKLEVLKKEIITKHGKRAYTGCRRGGEKWAGLGGELKTEKKTMRRYPVAHGVRGERRKTAYREEPGREWWWGTGGIYVAGPGGGKQKCRGERAQKKSRGGPQNAKRG